MPRYLVRRTRADAAIVDVDHADDAVAMAYDNDAWHDARTKYDLELLDVEDHIVALLKKGVFDEADQLIAEHGYDWVDMYERVYREGLYAEHEDA